MSGSARGPRAPGLVRGVPGVGRAGRGMGLGVGMGVGMGAGIGPARLVAAGAAAQGAAKCRGRRSWGSGRIPSPPARGEGGSGWGPDPSARC